MSSAPQPAPPSPYSPVPPAQLHPKPGDIAEVFGMRWRELEGIANRLRRMSRWQWDRLFRGMCVLFIGGAGGAAFGLIPFRSTTPAPSYNAQLVYVVAIAVAAAFGVLCGLASLAIKGERDDSVEAIREDLNRLLEPYREQIQEEEEEEKRERRRRLRWLRRGLSTS